MKNREKCESFPTRKFCNLFSRMILALSHDKLAVFVEVFLHKDEHNH